MDYYKTLGVEQTASVDDIKRAYKKLAIKHHPDRGGDSAEFKKIVEAYETLSDPAKREMYDAGGHRSFKFAASQFDDAFSSFFNEFDIRSQGQQRTFKNKNVRVRLAITLEEVLAGKEIDAEINMPSGQKIVTINIPPGVRNGQTILFNGLGDHSHATVPAGDLIVDIHVLPHERFTRDGDVLLKTEQITVWQALLGCTVDVVTMDRRTIKLKIPAGTQPGTTFSCKNEGIPNINTKLRGPLYIKVLVNIPVDLTDDQRKLIEQLQKTS
jgi:curved DNA-binding protein